MQKRFDSIIDLNGNAVEGATVRVITYPAGTLATIYSANSVLSPIPNPMTTDANGAFEYYAADGHYSWVITTDTSSKTINDVTHDDGVGDRDEQFVIPTGNGDAMVVAAFADGFIMIDGDDIRVRAPGPNTVSNPTITLPQVGTLTIFKLGGQPLDAIEGGITGTGSIAGAGHELTLRYNAALSRMEMLGVN